jgi:hypothetical protein
MLKSKKPSKDNSEHMVTQKWLQKLLAMLRESIIFLCKSSSVFDTWAFNEEWL